MHVRFVFIKQLNHQKNKYINIKKISGKWSLARVKKRRRSSGGDFDSIGLDYDVYYV